MKNLISIIIRTYNEEKYLEELLISINKQKLSKFKIETIIIDSGSTDSTTDIAKKYQVRLTYIDKKNFSFGRSLNLGCKFSKGEILVFISGHCVPTNSLWLSRLINPILNGFEYSYGKQIGRDTTKLSEMQVFAKQYPNTSSIPQENFFCNNANAAISRKIWKKYKFNEDITGCEDMELAKRYFNDGGKIAYISSAIVFHIHNEDWTSIRRRYERESIALQIIMPEINLKFTNAIYYFIVAIIKDYKFALKKNIFFKNFYSISRYRFEQYFGSYIGNHFSRKLSERKKIEYFYPRNIKN